jgi:hypothetical protein
VNGEQAPMVYPGKEKRGRPRASDYVLAAVGMRVTARYSGAADDLRLADEMLAQARTKQLPSTRTEIGAGGELIDREKVGSHLVDTVAHPDYVTAEASRDRLGLANQAGSLSLALDAADTIQAQDSLEKMLVHQMAVLHYGMMRAAARMNEELDAAGVIDPKVAAGMFDLNTRVRARLEALVRANAAPRCGARSKRTGKPCRGAAMPNGRCKLHGGKSTGPLTPEGLERSSRANWKHGYYSREAKAERSRSRAAMLVVRYLRAAMG